MSHPVDSPKRRVVLQALAAGATAPLLSAARAATPQNAWASSYEPYAGPLNPHFNGVIESADLKIEGRLPAGLRGTFYRNGPGRMRLGATAYSHRFDGDGMVQAMRLADGKASHRGALVRTPKLIEEEKAGRFLYGAFGAVNFTDTRPIHGPDSLNAANINLLSMNDGRDLYALWEGGSAVRIDPDTLATEGFKIWSPETAGAPFSAHPRVAPDGTVWSNGYLAGSGKLIIYEIAPDGKLRRQTVLNVPQADMVHDFAITERYLVFLLQPLVFGAAERAGQSLLERYRWQHDAPLVALLVNKSDFSTRRFELPNGGLFHMGNAWEENGVVRLGYARHGDILGALNHLRIGEPGSNSQHYPDWVEAELDLSSGKARQHATGLKQIEFPRFDARHTGRKTELAILMQRSAAMSPAVHGYNAVLSVMNGRLDRFVYESGTIAEEHIYVPRSAGSGEGSGWILGTSYHWPSERTALSIFDAQHLGAGPVARVRLPYGLPLAIHGQFVAA